MNYWIKIFHIYVAIVVSFTCLLQSEQENKLFIIFFLPRVIQFQLLYKKGKIINFKFKSLNYRNIVIYESYEVIIHNTTVIHKKKILKKQILRFICIIWWHVYRTILVKTYSEVITLCDLYIYEERHTKFTIKITNKVKWN